MKKIIYFLLITISTLYGCQNSGGKTVKQCNQTIVGKLDNGLTYYVRKNPASKNRASFYFIQNTGAILEKDSQNGFAHFLEHMAFNGTKNFPDKNIIKILEKHGLSFGGNLNAYTAYDETAYNISYVPTSNKQLLDTCLQVLHDWSHCISLDDKEIDAERGVILEEWRARRTHAFRLNSIINPQLYKGSMYAKRDVIGDMDIISNFKCDELRQFYNDWYRTDLQAIVVVGDFDSQEMIEKIKSLFSHIPKSINPQERKEQYIPNFKKRRYVLATDSEATSSSVQVISILPKPDIDKYSDLYWRNGLITSFFNSMTESRLSEMMQKKNQPFLSAQIGYTGLVRNHSSYYCIAGAKPNEETQALKAILTEHMRIVKYGFHTSELERAKIKLKSNIESVYQQKHKIDNESYINGIKNNFLQGNPIVDYESYYAYVMKTIPTITTEDINNQFKNWNIENNKITIISGSDKATHLTEEEVDGIFNVVYADESILPFEDEFIGKDIITDQLTGSKIIEEKEVEAISSTEFILENGVKVVYKEVNYEKDNVLLFAYSNGGTSQYDIKDIPNAENADVFAKMYGIGEFSNIALSKALVGKRANCNVNIGVQSETLKGSSSTHDVETMLQLMYLRFVHPRVDKESYETLLEQNYIRLKNNEYNPSRIIQDSITRITSNYHPRTILFTNEYLGQLDMEQMHKIYKERFANARDFTFFLSGDIKKDKIKPLIEKYIGSLPVSSKIESWKDRGIRSPRGLVEKEIEVYLDTPKSIVVTSFTKRMKYSIEYSYLNVILKEILDMRYAENIREKEGGTYEVTVHASSNKKPSEQFNISMTFECAPSNAKYLKSLIYKEIEDVKKNGVTQSEIDAVVKNMLNKHKQSKYSNSYWLNIISTYYIHDINNNDPKNFEEILYNATPKLISEFANKIFDNGDIIDIIFIPKK